MSERLQRDKLSTGSGSRIGGLHPNTPTSLFRSDSGLGNVTLLEGRVSFSALGDFRRRMTTFRGLTGLRALFQGLYSHKSFRTPKLPVES